MDQQWQEAANDMAKHLVIMKNGASTNGDLNVVAKQLEMLAQKIKKKNSEVQKLQKENERMEKNFGGITKSIGKPSRESTL